jgi:hypothetical protein
MLLSAADPSDEVGVIAFGDHARWIGASETARKPDFNLDDLEKVGQADQHTDFADLIQFWNDFLSRKPSGFFDTHEASLVLLTDGQPDALGESAASNAGRSLTLASETESRGKIYTIALGPEARKSTFLNQLAEASGGSSATANTEGDLTDAFLRIATRVLRLPAYQRLDVPGMLSNFGIPKRALIVFLGGSDLVVAGGRAILTAPSVKVVDVSGVKAGAAISWRGRGTAFYCVGDPLILSLAKSIPTAVLTNSEVPIGVRLSSSNQTSIGKPYFLEGADVQLVAVSQSGSLPQKVSLDREDGNLYSGVLGISEPGSYELFSKLSAHYGELDQPLARLNVSDSPVAIPNQVSLSVFDPLPRKWFLDRLPASLALPAGAATITFEPGPYVGIRPNSFTLTVGETKQVSMEAREIFGPGTIQLQMYHTTWSDGTRTSSFVGETRIYLRQMTLEQFLAAKWTWLLITLAGLVILIGSIKTFAPRPLRGRLQVTQDGLVVASIDMPKEKRSRSVSVRTASSPTADKTTKSSVVIKGDIDEEIATLVSQRYNGRWTTLVKPGPFGLDTPSGPIFQITDLRKIAHRSVLSQDRRVEITFK